MFPHIPNYLRLKSFFNIKGPRIILTEEFSRVKGTQTLELSIRSKITKTADHDKGIWNFHKRQIFSD